MVNPLLFQSWISADLFANKTCVLRLVLFYATNTPSQTGNIQNFREEITPSSSDCLLICVIWKFSVILVHLESSQRLIESKIPNFYPKEDYSPRVRPRFHDQDRDSFVRKQPASTNVVREKERIRGTRVWDSSSILYYQMHTSPRHEQTFRLGSLRITLDLELGMCSIKLQALRLWSLILFWWYRHCLVLMSHLDFVIEG